MKILIINNQTKRLKELKKLLKGNSLEIVNVGKIDEIKLKDFDLIILSGSSNRSVFNEQNVYQKELNLIKKTNKPIIGICLGFQLICLAYGARFKKLESKSKKVINIRVTKVSDIFKDLPNLMVYEAHRYAIEKLSKELVELARSDDGIEVARHREKPIYGFQFHPEMLVKETCGDEIFKNLLGMIKRSVDRDYRKMAIG
ncbi:MAG: gamma-glutamyl-gamma-aminobutyrate hydrolase family protein [Patescibacteria group bacterium]|nr:gamma-glutamyl-gamma-aminobutyrate hydrolase family protein [Patescibacteria group bacterium]